MEINAPTADAAEFTSPLPQLTEPALDPFAERAAWALALAAWMQAPDADASPLPTPDPQPSLPDPAPAEWWSIMPHASDWWM
jgi:hypothetical protein